MNEHLITKNANLHGCTTLTCNMVDRIEANSKSAYFQWIFSLPASGNLLNSVPIFSRKHCIVVHIQSWACNQ